MKFVACMKNALKTKQIYESYPKKNIYRNSECEVHKVGLKDSGNQNISSLTLTLTLGLWPFLKTFAEMPENWVSPKWVELSKNRFLTQKIGGQKVLIHQSSDSDENS
jgi:hypothetical protein